VKPRRLNYSSQTKTQGGHAPHDRRATSEPAGFPPAIQPLVHIPETNSLRRGRGPNDFRKIFALNRPTERAFAAVRICICRSNGPAVRYVWETRVI